MFAMARTALCCGRHDLADEAGRDLELRFCVVERLLRLSPLVPN